MLFYVIVDSIVKIFEHRGCIRFVLEYPFHRSVKHVRFHSDVCQSSTQRSWVSRGNKRIEISDRFEGNYLIVNIFHEVFDIGGLSDGFSNRPIDEDNRLK
uniref:Uncharacterized protein n=1 Tax=Pseudictyota dubia TaxID=2749911 RepID=A0A7R9VFU6_9STRA|mmetsp:Transcript_13594/g.25477  ORF Transcript_13594/g.25477 Transcript_13594/m.25477 type:complete len:100 (+) Transcript_13594:380-679(+)